VTTKILERMIAKKLSLAQAIAIWCHQEQNKVHDYGDATRDGTFDHKLDAKLHLAKSTSG
jgi:hypothetical protein